MAAKYSFFETATQKGYILQVFGELIPNHWERIVQSDPVGTSFRFAASPQAAEELAIDVTFEGRTTRESTTMWRDRVREEAHKAWEAYGIKQAERRRALAAEAAAAEAAKAPAPKVEEPPIFPRLSRKNKPKAGAASS